MADRLTIAEELLGCALGNGGFAPCPGKGKHSKGDGVRDFRVILEGAPTGYCFHASCSDEVAAFNKELRRRIWFAEHGHSPAPRGSWAEGVAPAPRADLEARPPLDPHHVWEFTRGVPDVSSDWLRRRSPIGAETRKQFFEALYAPGERILIFTDEHSQGDFLWWVGPGSFRLAQERGVKAAASNVPAGGPKGVWFMVQPVSGQWAINPNSVKAGGSAKWSRRCEANVTGWRYYVLESDELELGEWLKVVVNLPLPIAAIYTSGSRSVHVLVKCEVPSKSTWDATRNVLRQIVCPLGADPGALSAVRLSRLPFSRRGEHGRQELWFLNPSPDYTPIRMMPEVRG